MEILVLLVVIVQISQIASEPASQQNATFLHADVGTETRNFVQLWEEEEGNQSKDYLTNAIAKGFLASFPLNNKSQCELDVGVILRKAAKFELWALQMFDATGKLPSGILNGNLNQFGDFDECLAVEGKQDDRVILGKYCLSDVDIQLKHHSTREDLKVLDDAIHSNRMLRNDIYDPGHRIPKMETFNWGLCVPASCTPKEVEDAFKNYLDKHMKSSIFTLKTSVSGELCYVKRSSEMSITKVLIRCILTLLCVSPILISFIDLNKLALTKPKMAEILGCFCIKNNWRRLLKTESGDDEITCFHGGRFLFALALLLSHKQISMLFTPMYNRTAMSEEFSGSWTMIGRSAILYTDAFLLISGTLVSYSFTKDLDKTKAINFKDKLITRIFRFTPNLVGIILFTTFVMEDMGSGPQWGLVVTKYANLCKKHMWKNFLYVHNYFGFDNMCLTHTHQLGIDMQLFLFSPIFVYAIWKFPKVGLLFLLGLSIFSTWLRYSITLAQNLSTILYYGISVEQLWRTANNSYILPTHRLTVYLSGILLGYYLRRENKFSKLSSLQISLGWIAALAACLVAVFGPYTAGLKTYTYDALESSRFNAFAPILWCFFLIWVTLACVNNHDSYINKFLSWKYFRIFTRISYAIYLTQFPVFFYYVGQVRVPQTFDKFQSLFDLKELFIIISVSVLLTLTFDIPFQEVRKVLRKKDKEKKEDLSDSNKETEVVEETEGSGKKRKLHMFGT